MASQFSTISITINSHCHPYTTSPHFPTNVTPPPPHTHTHPSLSLRISLSHPQFLDAEFVAEHFTDRCHLPQGDDPILVEVDGIEPSLVTCNYIRGQVQRLKSFHSVKYTRMLRKCSEGIHSPDGVELMPVIIVFWFGVRMLKMDISFICYKRKQFELLVIVITLHIQNQYANDYIC